MSYPNPFLLFRAPYCSLYFQSDQTKQGTHRIYTPPAEYMNNLFGHAKSTWQAKNAKATVALEVARPNIVRQAVFLIEQYSDGPIPCSSNGAAVRFCDRSHSAIKRSSTSATALTSIDLFLGSNNGLYLGSNNGLFLRSNSGPFLRPTSQTYYGIYRWYLAWRHVILYYYSIYNSTWGEQYGSQ